MGLSSGGFRVAGAGGLANIASILGASGISFKTSVDDSDDSDDEEIHIIGGGEREASSDASEQATIEEVEDAHGEGAGGVKASERDTKPRDVTGELVSCDLPHLPNTSTLFVFWVPVLPIA